MTFRLEDDIIDKIDLYKIIILHKRLKRHLRRR